MPSRSRSRSPAAAAGSSRSAADTELGAQGEPGDVFAAVTKAVAALALGALPCAVLVLGALAAQNRLEGRAFWNATHPLSSEDELAVSLQFWLRKLCLPVAGLALAALAIARCPERTRIYLGYRYAILVSVGTAAVAARGAWVGASCAAAALGPTLAQLALPLQDAAASALAGVDPRVLRALVALAAAARLALYLHGPAAAPTLPHAEAARRVGQLRRVAVIGAGPSGLVCAKYLRDEGIEVQVFETEADVGGTFRYRAYDGATQVSSKYMTAFADLRLPPSAADHLPVPEYLEYLHEYCEKFALYPLISFQTKVRSVERQGGASEDMGARCRAWEQVRCPPASRT